MKWEVIWEVVQTTFPFLAGKFLGDASRNQPKTDGGPAEAALKQQTTSILRPRNDEAIQLAVDAALRKLPDGEEHIRNVQMVRDALKPHQQSDWRKNLGTHELTERFEHVMASETITRTNRGDPNQAPAGQQPRGGQEKIERKFERRPRDYELTAQDPRVMHLVLVSKIVSAEGHVKAKDYLLSAGLISELSPQEKVAVAAKQARDVTTKSLYQSTLSRPVMDQVRRQEQVIEATMDPAARKNLQQVLETYIVIQSREENTRANRRLLMAFGLFLGILITFFVVGLIIAATLKYN